MTLTLFYLSDLTNKPSHTVIQLEVNEVADVLAQTGFGVDDGVADRRIELDRHVLDCHRIAIDLRLIEGYDTVNDLTCAGVNELVGHCNGLVCEGECALDAVKPLALVSASNVRGEYTVFKLGINGRRVASCELKHSVNDRNTVTAG